MSSDDRQTKPGGEEPAPHPSVVSLARLVLRIFYRKIEIQGLEKVPRDVPLVFVANHVNSLVDPTLLIAYMPAPPRFLATSELWQNPILKPFLLWAAAIPVYRRQVEGFDPEKNRRTFERCHEVLAAGGHIGILPEGTSHNEPALVQLRTGVGRIVLEAEGRFKGLATRVVPVGFTFEDRGRFRSTALVQIGDAIDPAPQIESYAAHPRAAVKALVERIREALVGLTLNFSSWEEADLIERAAEIYQRPATAAPPIPLSQRVELRRAFIDGYRKLSTEHPERVEKVAASVRRYEELLRHQRLLDEQVAATYPPAVIARFTLRSLWLLLIRLPLGLVGTLVHWLPFQAASWVARRWPETGDLKATYKVVASMVFYPLTWLALAIGAGWIWNLPAGFVILVLGPWSAGVALRLTLRSRLFWSRARGFLLLRSGKASIAELRRSRQEALQAIRRLVARYEDGI